MKFINQKIIATLFCALALCVPAEILAAPKAKAPRGNDTAVVWTKKAKTFAGKPVSTLVADIGRSGIAQSDAPFVAVPITTANSKQEEGGEILVLVSFADYTTFVAKYAPVFEKGGNAFGKKMTMKPISGTFFVHKGEPVLLVGIKPDAIAKEAKISDRLAAQIAAEDEAKKSE